MQETIFPPSPIESGYSQERLREITDAFAAMTPGFHLSKGILNELRVDWLPSEVVVQSGQGVVSDGERCWFYRNDGPLHIPVRYEHRGKRLGILLVRDNLLQMIRVRAKVVTRRTRLVNNGQMQEFLLGEKQIPVSIWAK